MMRGLRAEVILAYEGIHRSRIDKLLDNKSRLEITCQKKINKKVVCVSVLTL